MVGSAVFTVDPQNATNEVFAVDNTNDFGGAYRALPKGTKADQLDNQVQLDYFFQGTKTCAAGSPRIQLGIDTNGDGTRDGNAFGYLGDKPFGGLCPANMWVLEDMTDGAAKWDLSQLGGSMTNTWDQMEAFLAGAYSNYQMLTGFLVEDPTYTGGPPPGVTYYDDFVMGNRTLSTHADAATS